MSPPRRDPALGWAHPRPPTGKGDRAFLQARVLRPRVHVSDLTFRCHSGVWGPRLSPKPRPMSGRQWAGFRPPLQPRAAASACMPRSRPAPCSSLPPGAKSRLPTWSESGPWLWVTTRVCACASSSRCLCRKTSEYRFIQVFISSSPFQFSNSLFISFMFSEITHGSLQCLIICLLKWVFCPLKKSSCTCSKVHFAVFSSVGFL